MKIKIQKNTYAPFNLVSERGEYDAIPPVDTLQVDFAPQLLNSDRLAIASYLVFGDFSSGDFELPLKCSPAAAEAIEQDAAPVQLRPAPIEYYPKALSAGQITAAVQFDLSSASSEHGIFSILPSDRYNGMIVGHKQLIVSSNAFLFDSLNHRINSIRARLAVAVLFAEDFGVDTLRIDGITIDAQEKIALVRLLAACRLGLGFQL